MWFINPSSMVTSYIDIELSTVANVVEAKQVRFEEYFLNNDCEVILTQL